MDVAQSRSEVFWMAFSSLSKKERQAIVQRLLQDPEFLEDLTDIITIELRKGEPARSFRAYLAEKEVASQT